MGYVKPDRVGEWNSGLTNQTEPSGAKKILGWALNEAPASSFFNWLLYTGYRWYRWLNERVADGATNDDAIFQGVDAGAGTNLSGGEGAMSGGQATGTGSSQSKLRAATAGTSGSGTRNPEDYLTANGATERVETSKTTQLNATDATVAPLKVAQQSADPSSVNSGDVFSHQTIDQLAHLGPGGRWQNLDTVVNAMGTVGSGVSGTAAETVLPGAASSYTIPANTLRAGSVIKVKAAIIGGAVGTPTVWWRFRLGGLAGALLFTNSRAVGAGTHESWFELALRVNTIGASGQIYCRGAQMSHDTGGSVVKLDVTGAGPTVDTTVDQDLVATIEFSVSSGSNTAALSQFLVEVC